MAAGMSIFLGSVFAIISIGMLSTIAHVNAVFLNIGELVDCAYSAVEAMPSMLIPPLLEAFVRFFLMWMLCYNFMSLVSVGWKDEYRIEINGVHYAGPNKKWYFDYSELGYIIYYVIGAIWLMELPTAFGQFMISFSVVSWYYMPKEMGKKMATPRLPPLHAFSHGVFHHFGSLLLGAFIIPYMRGPRMIYAALFGTSATPIREEDQHCCCRIVDKIGEFFKGCFGHCAVDSLCGDAGAFNVWDKNAYTDIVIRSNHFLHAALKVRSILAFHTACQKFNGKLRIITIVGVLSIGMACGGLTWIFVVNLEAFYDPTSSMYIDDPIMVSSLAFILGAMIAYGFMALIDHTSDVLLYCYAWSKKFKRDAVDKYVPDNLRQIVGYEDKNSDEYAYYGRANPNMYLGTWFSTKPSDKRAAGKQAAKSMDDKRILMASRNDMDMPYATGGPGGYPTSPGYGGPGGTYGGSPYNDTQAPLMHR
jgi:hypothetical protein